jgi:hypothetical protein
MGATSEIAQALDVLAGNGIEVTVIPPEKVGRSRSSTP